MRPNILHNKFHPTDYDRLAFIQDHFEELKEMYFTIMEHLKVPVIVTGGEGEGGGGDTPEGIKYEYRFTTDKYIRIDFSEYLEDDTLYPGLSLEGKKEAIRKLSKISCQFYEDYVDKGVHIKGQWDGNYLCFPTRTELFRDLFRYNNPYLIFTDETFTRIFELRGIKFTVYDNNAKFDLTPNTYKLVKEVSNSDRNRFPYEDFNRYESDLVPVSGDPLPEIEFYQDFGDKNLLLRENFYDN